MPAQNSDQAPGLSPRKGVSSFLKALLSTAIPIVALNVISIPVVKPSSEEDRLFLLAGLGTSLWIVAMLTCLGFAIARKRQIALGILAGAAIGALGVGVTCFAPGLTPRL